MKIDLTLLDEDIKYREQCIKYWAGRCDTDRDERLLSYMKQLEDYLTKSTEETTNKETESENFNTTDGFDEYLENIGKKEREELENLKKENARLSELVNVLEEQIKVLNTQLRLQRELASKQEFNPLSQMQISQQERDFLIRQNTISQMNSFSKETGLK